MSKIGIFHFFALAIVGIGYSTAEPQKQMQPRIIKGNACKTTEVPYFVLVRNSGICGGFLVTYEWALTAAHCIIPRYLLKGSKIYSGFDMPPELSQVRKAKEFHRHPKFSDKEFRKLNDFRYDIGLVLVDKPFRQTAATHVATLPAPGFAKHCKEVMAPGVGLTSNNEYVWDKPATARPVNCVVNLSIIDNNTCKKQYAQGRTILFDDTIMCMHGSRKGVCRGDSGGPVLCDNVAIGINSMAPKDCEAAPMGSTFTLIESHLDFIDNTVKFTGILHV